MESEHIISSNEHVNKNPQVNKHDDGIPLLKGENRDVSVSSPSSSSMEVDKGEKSPTQSDENPSVPQEPQSQMQSPPIQTMGQPPPVGYDPNRIPSSIFSAKPTNPTEWSVASNESLFSIHMGNNSFSRDYAILFGKSGDFQDCQGSQSNMFGELPRLDEWNNNAQSKPNELSSQLPPVMESPSHEESSRIQKKDNSECRNVDPGAKVEKHEKEAMPAETTTTTLTSSSCPLEKHEKEKPVAAEAVNINRPDTFPSPPRFSDDSGNSGSSFAFPVLVSDGGKPASLKVVPEKPEQPTSQAQGSNETPIASETRWWSSLLCWPRCC
ncbi:hypothetical protein DH2020_012262 [Rehmannia glutinosa]|uniref:Uncharacterized protein n=1 Tax=Rehmannia glutinosa TaxID=99300 RepID=A0ABR0WYT7_REHGL